MNTPESPAAFGQSRHVSRWQYAKVWLTLAAGVLIALRILFPEALTVQGAGGSNLYVADTSKNQVLRYDGTTGQFVATIAEFFYPAPKEPRPYVLSRPSGLALGSDGLLYVSSAGTKQILRFNPRTNTFVDVFIAPGGPYPTPGNGRYDVVSPSDLLFGPNGNLYVLNEFGRIQRFDGRTGAYLDLLQPTTYTIGGIAFGADDDLYVTVPFNDVVLRLDATTGRVLNTFVPPGSGGLERPGKLAFGPDGNLYVISNATNEVLRYNGRTGAFLGVFVQGSIDTPYPIPGGPDTGLVSPTGLAFGPDGNLYVSSSRFRAVLRFNGKTGAFINLFVAPDSGNLFSPGALLFDTAPRARALDAQSKPAFVTVTQRASPSLAARPGDTLTYTVVTTNRGAGAASDTTVTLPFDSARQSLLDATFSRKGAWVSSVSDGALVFQTGRLGSSGDVVTATLRFTVQPDLAAGTALGERLRFRWSDGRGGGSGESNLLPLVVAEAASDPPFYPLAVEATGSTRVFTSAIFAPNEPVALWRNTPDGAVVAVAQVKADANGAIRVALDASKLAAGDHSMVARGAWSELTAVAAFKIE